MGVFFFFQAEDGIRDADVTGVQTCALPISRTGTVLWKFKVGSGVVANPITYAGPDGKQYVAVYAGIGGDWFLLAGDVRSDDPADVRPPADFMPDIARHTSQGGILSIFGF